MQTTTRTETATGTAYGVYCSECERHTLTGATTEHEAVMAAADHEREFHPVTPDAWAVAYETALEAIPASRARGVLHNGEVLDAIISALSAAGLSYADAREADVPSAIAAAAEDLAERERLAEELGL